MAVSTSTAEMPGVRAFVGVRARQMVRTAHADALTHPPGGFPIRNNLLATRWMVTVVAGDAIERDDVVARGKTATVSVVMLPVELAVSLTGLPSGRPRDPPGF